MGDYILNFLDYVNIEGYLTIKKSTFDGEEVLYSDYNTIVSGMGLGMVELFSSENDIDQFLTQNFQLGVSGTPSLEDISTQELGRALSSLEEYGYNNETLKYTLKNQYKYSKVFPDTVFGVIPLSNIFAISDGVIRHKIVIDNEDANDISINEIGLFMKNPLATTPDTAVLVAYKTFPTITKTEDYSIIFEWDIDFSMNS